MCAKSYEQTCLELSCSFFIFQSFILIIEQFWFSHLFSFYCISDILLYKIQVSRNALWLIWGLKTRLQRRKVPLLKFQRDQIKVLHHYFLIAVNPSTDPSEGLKSSGRKFRKLESSLVDFTWREVLAFRLWKSFDPKTRKWTLWGCFYSCITSGLDFRPQNSALKPLNIT